MSKIPDSRTGINWETFQKLEDLEFADNICLIKCNKIQMQRKTNDGSKESGAKNKSEKDKNP